MMERQILTMTSQTLAIKAKRVLFHEGISVRIVRPSPHLTPKGCTFGLEMTNSEILRIIHILEKHQIPFGEIIGI